MTYTISGLSIAQTNEIHAMASRYVSRPMDLNHTSYYEIEDLEQLEEWIYKNGLYTSPHRVNGMRHTRISAQLSTVS